MSSVLGFDLKPSLSGERRGLLRAWGHYGWIVRRLISAVVTLLGLSVIIFGATQLLPGNAAQQILGRAATPEGVRELSVQLGLDRPVPVQYLSWLENLLRGDLGNSLAGAHQPVAQIIGPAIANSAAIITFSAVVALMVAVVLGTLSAARRDGIFDGVFSGFTLLFTAVPEFVVGIVLVIVFATAVLQILPAVSYIPAGQSAFSDVTVFVLPVMTLILACVPYLARLVRGSMIDALESEYVRMARFKGLSERKILFRHALPNALIPLIQGTAMTLGYLAGGIVTVEFVFGFPGIGTVLTSAISSRDVPTIQAVSLSLAALYVVVNLLADFLVVFVTPRLRTRML